MLYQLRPRSGMLAELAAPPPGCRTRFIRLWSELDGFIVPQHNARLDPPDLLVTNHRLCDVGHLSLAVDPRAARTVVAALTEVKGAAHSTAASRNQPIDTQAPIARSSPPPPRSRSSRPSGAADRTLADTAGRITERRLARPCRSSLPSAGPRPRSEYGWPSGWFSPAIAGPHPPSARTPKREGRSWLDTVRHAANDHLRWLRPRWHMVLRVLARRPLACRNLTCRILGRRTLTS